MWAIGWLSTYTRRVAPLSKSSKTPSPRRPTFLGLCIGTVAALACAVGPLWMVRLGVLIAIAMAVISVVSSWRQMDRMVTEHMAQLRELREQARQASSAHHQEMMATIERFTARSASYKAEIARHRAELDELRAGLASANLDAEAKQTRISALNKIVSDLEKQLEQAVDEVELARQVMSLPRRGVSGRRSTPDISGLPLVYPTQERRQA